MHDVVNVYLEEENIIISVHERLEFFSNILARSACIKLEVENEGSAVGFFNNLSEGILTFRERWNRGLVDNDLFILRIGFGFVSSGFSDGCSFDFFALSFDKSLSSGFSFSFSVSSGFIGSFLFNTGSFSLNNGCFLFTRNSFSFSFDFGSFLCDASQISCGFIGKFLGNANSISFFKKFSFSNSISEGFSFGGSFLLSLDKSFCGSLFFSKFLLNADLLVGSLLSSNISNASRF